ncbi:putative protein OS=Tsukamurella paurometabola (strain ATCC 8368 / DSM / CCUG 35730 /CIP 100753 / JCM 10117 / KCTC 9821 / NBRC 16120 / NCIMB 702349/ NCTC 13040) OX=521096 GN=Tpau_2469 PE=4 SV=1 [Tsukamurella paurometabola]|uniref:Uncharacterized protein n=1 Tax=Tsukamurella paurometabola (strain ATCC 8368 / DSM 20162 / CCUG 35730 / CIP 100753 / JCM 10117 / KCTC 9821 / NBRC 16120 / NCIMB 702349 / NCTC 13040) TaxID=521096 RepID=D5UR85_TSUPD|nr:hypothetical protein Tpau_2469 [Tsukamurella paurometabola DSM 20162]SUP33985.1 Uncharacterised protein [Tsukamurella paurometabola]
MLAALIGTLGAVGVTASQSRGGEPTLQPVRNHDGRYTDKYCIVQSDGTVIECSKLDGGLTIYSNGQKPFIVQDAPMPSSTN